MADTGGNELSSQREPISLGGLQKFGPLLPNMLYDFAANFSPSGIYNALAAPFQQAGEATDRALHSPALTLDPEAMRGLTQATANFGLLSAGVPKPPGSLGVFGGMNAMGAVMSALAKARAAETAAVHPQEIWQQHGWWKGPDGKWRFEIPDDTSKLTFPLHDAQGHIIPPDETGHFPPTLNTNFSAMVASTQPRTLGEVLDHPDLYRNYPDLKDIKVKGLTEDEVNAGAGGGYDHRSDTLFVSGGDPKEQLPIILHEVQHAIQSREGFSYGSSPFKYLRPTFGQEFDLANHVGTIMADRMKSMGYDAQEVWDVWKQFDHDPRALTRDEIRMLQSAQQDLGTTFMQDFKAHGRILDDLHDEFQGGWEKYNRVAGEVEARAVMERLGLSREDLKRTFPPATQGYIPIQDQVDVQLKATP